MNLVYLVGPISGMTWKEATEWRRFVADMLGTFGIAALDPLRGKQFLEKRTIRGVITSTYEDQTITSAQGIFGRDLFDVRRSDVVLANFLGARKVSQFSLIELGVALDRQKPIVLVMERQGNPHESRLLRERVATYVTDDLRESVVLTRYLLCP